MAFHLTDYERMKHRLARIQPSMGSDAAREASQLGEFDTVLRYIGQLSSQGAVCICVGLHFETTLLELKRRGFLVESHGPHFLISWLSEVDLETEQLPPER